MTRKEIADGLAVINYQYKYGGNRFTDEERQIISNAIAELQKDILYLCDKNACSECSGIECRHTNNITHAMNFEIGIDGKYYVEKGDIKIDRSDCCQCIHNGAYRCTNPEEITVNKHGCSGHTTILEGRSLNDI